MLDNAPAILPRLSEIVEAYEKQRAALPGAVADFGAAVAAIERAACIGGAYGILRLKKGIQKQVKLYKRNGRVFAPYGGGYIEIRAQEHDGTHSTAHPDVKLLEFECEDVHYEKEIGQQRLRYGRRSLRAA